MVDHTDDGPLIYTGDLLIASVSGSTEHIEVRGLDEQTTEANASLLAAAPDLLAALERVLEHGERLNGQPSTCCDRQGEGPERVMANQQWNPETTDRGWHWLRRRDNLEWRLAFRDRLGGGWRVSDVVGRTAATSSGKVGRLFTYHGPVRRHDEPKDL